MPGTAGETDGEMLARLGTDAALWAHELVETVRTMAAREAADPGPSGPMSAEDIILCDSPGEVLHVWLCNAIEAGRVAGYATGRRRADAIAAELAGDLEADGDPVRADVAEDIRDRLTGWPIGALPENLAASGLPANPAASDLPANLAGSYEFPRHMERIAEALERLASVVAPTSRVWAAPSLRVEPLS